MPPEPQAGVIDAALVGRQHLHQQRHDRARGIELAALLAFGTGKLGEEVLIHAAQDILGSIRLVAQADVAHQVDQLAESRLVEPRVGVILGQHPFERRVVPLDGQHGVIDNLADRRLPGVGLQHRPARLWRHPEAIDRPILVRVLRVGAQRPLCFQPGALFLEGVGDVLEEDQAKHHVLVFGCVHVGTQHVSGLPQLPFKTEIGAVGLFCHCRLSSPLYGGIDHCRKRGRAGLHWASVQTRESRKT
jgi:hypothetical protein